MREGSWYFLMMEVTLPWVRGGYHVQLEIVEAAYGSVERVEGCFGVVCWTDGMETER